MSYQDLIYGVEDGIATITLNRPARMNALSHNLEAELHRAFDEADADRTVRVIILTGSGTAFCAGFDQGPNKSGRRNSDPVPVPSASGNPPSSAHMVVIMIGRNLNRQAS